MNWPARADAVVAAFAGVAAVGASFIVTGLTKTFVVLSVDGILVSLAPGWIVAAVIQQFGKAGHLLHQLPATAIVISAYAIAALAGLQIAYRTDRRLFGGLLAGALGWGITIVLTGALTQALAPATALLLVIGLAPDPATSIEHIDVERRSVLRAAGGAITAVGLGSVLHVVNDRPKPPTELPGGDSVPTAMLSSAAEHSLDIDGIDPLISEPFYEVDINPAANPAVSTDDWTLSVTGAVDQELEFSYQELTTMERDHRYVTLRCVSDQINGDLMDNAVWTGVPAQTILDQATPQSGCECVMLRAADGYFEEFPLAALEPGLLAYGMNARSLPRNHGYPLRALVPGHWGEVNVKWLTEIEILDQEAEGYWEQRGWHGTGPVHTIAKLHAVNHHGDGTITLGGHAYAGTRGITAVEVSTDGGTTWRRADLSEPLPGDDVWRQWRYQYQPRDAHTVVVRAIDGTGTVQPQDATDPFPSGSTGWVSRRIE